MTFRLFTALTLALVLCWGCGGKKDNAAGADKAPKAAPVKPADKAGEAKPAAAAGEDKKAAKAGDAKPATAKPATAKPATAKPATAKPATAKPTSPKALPKRPAPAKGAKADRTPPTRKGAKNPKVLIAEISDFQCPFCNRVNPTIKQILETYPEDVAVEFYHNALPFHKDAKGAAVASMAAQRQGKFWEMHDKMFANMKALKANNLESYAKEIGLDIAKYKKDITDPTLAARVERDMAMANAVGASGTPAFFINGKNLKGAQPFPKFKAIIDAEIAAAGDKRGEAWLKERLKVNNAKLHGFMTWEKEPPAAAKRKPKARPVDRTVYKVDVDVSKDGVKGNKTEALVTLVEFSEFQCPFCSRINPTIAKIMSTYGDKVRVIFKHNPLPFHKEAFPAAEASLCARDQGKFWEMHDKLFANQRALQRDKLDGYAGELGLDMGKFKKCMDSRKHKAQIDADMALSGKVTARGTPNTFVNGRKLTGAKPFAEFKTVIDEELKKAEALVAKGTAKSEVYAQIIKNGKIFQPLEDKVNTFNLENAARIGPKNAKIQIVEFSDFQCPFCARVGEPLKQVQKHYGDKAAIYFKHFPLSFHKQAHSAAQASICADRQGKFWPFHDLLFKNLKQIAPDKYSGWAKEAGVDVAKFEKCLKDPAVKQQVDADMADGRKAGVRGTPSVYINGRKFSSPSGYSLRAFTSVIDKHILKK